MTPNTASMLDTSLVIGADGLIGHALLSDLTFKGQPVIGSTRRKPSKSHSQLLIDLADSPSNWYLPKRICTAYICAGIVSIEHCRQHPYATAAINCKATITLANALADRGARVIYLSSNQVFDGSIAQRKASDLICPITEYGRQKATTENAILQLGKQGVVVRLTKVLDHANTLLGKWCHDLKQGKTIQPFDDMHMAPVSVTHVVNALAMIGKLPLQTSDRVMHISATHDVTYAQAAHHLAKRLAADASLIDPISASTANIHISARPRHTTLDTNILTTLTGLTPPDPLHTLDASLDFQSQSPGFAKPWS